MEYQATIAGDAIVRLPVDAVRPNPYQPRKLFERASLAELADSIREYGVIQPISVRQIGACSYELVAGERRLRAAKQAGLSAIPAVVVNISDKDSAIMALIENLQRQNLNFLEEAEGFLCLMKDYQFTQEQLAKKIGKSQSAVANKMRVLRLPKSVHVLLVDNELTERHARALLRLDTEAEQIEAVQKIVKGGLTVKKTEDLVESMLGSRSVRGKNKTAVKIRRFVRDIKIFTNTIKQAVDIMRGSGVDTEYYIEESDGGCDIKIRIVY